MSTKKEKATKKKIKGVNGENMVYYILQKYNTKNPSDEIKKMIERLLLDGGVWFTPETYEQIPVLRPYAIRDTTCRKKNPATKKDSWAHANSKGLLRDDNSSIKDIPKTLEIISSRIKKLKNRKMGEKWVASHVWMTMKNGYHACQWECANSFIPDLVWLPKQLSKLTDDDGSYAQQFIKHISYLLYRDIPFSGSTKEMIDGIWDELETPGIEPVSKFKLDDLNYFDHKDKWINRKKATLHRELTSIVAILNNHEADVPEIYNVKYTSTLREVSESMSNKDKEAFKDWLESNLNALGTPSVTKVTSSTKATGVSTSKPKTKTTSTTSGRKKTTHGSGLSSYTDDQIANSIKAFLFEGLSYRKIEHTYLGMPKRANGGGWAAQHLLESNGLYNPMKNMFSGRTIADAISMSSEPLKSKLIWMKANL